MKAVVLTDYGSADGLQLRTLNAPAPREGELVVRVVVTTVTMGDTELRASNMPWLFWLPLRLWLGLFKPREELVLGMELAGVVHAIGPGVTAFRVGEAVFAMSPGGTGAHAEFVVLRVDGLIARKPASLPFEAVAPLPVAGLAALGYLRKGGVGEGKRILVRGASGSIGTYAVQLAKHFGAHVTAVCPPQAVQRMEALGADEVVDYTRSDFTDNGVAYDLILDVVGKMPVFRALRSVGRRGAYVRGTVPGLWELLVALGARVITGKRVLLLDAGGSADDLTFLAGLIEAGEVETVIDRRYPLAEIVDAHRYVETGHKQGHVVIRIAED